jgi:hypothetical protein
MTKIRNVALWPAVLLIAACEHTLVVGEHGPGLDEDAAGQDADVMARTDASQDSAPPRPDAPDMTTRDATSEPPPQIADAPVDVGPGLDATSERADASDALLADAKPIDASTKDADAADRPVIPGCLPDGAGALTFRSSGGLVLDVMRGNEITCTSNVMGGQVTVGDLVPRILSGIVSLQIDLTFTSLPPGFTGTTSVSVHLTEYAGAVPPVWTSSSPCSADITSNALLEPVDGGSLYEISASLSCPSALTPAANNAQGPMTIDAYTFTTGVVYP